MAESATGPEPIVETTSPERPEPESADPLRKADAALEKPGAQGPPRELRERLAAVRLLAMDVDGVLTDGTIIWSAHPEESEAVLETKAFSVKDGLGLSLARIAGLQVAWITGRTSAVVERRARELGVTELHQWARNKARVLEEIQRRHTLPPAAVAFVGDDLNDVPAFRAAGVRIAVADAAPELRGQADWITEAPGGRGAIREVIEAILRAQGRWEEVLACFYERLEQEGDQ